MGSEPFFLAAAALVLGCRTSGPGLDEAPAPLPVAPAVVIPEELPPLPPPWESLSVSPQPSVSALSTQWLDASGVLEGAPEADVQRFPEVYSELDAITTFRGGPLRDAPTWGSREVGQGVLESVWVAETTAGRVGSVWGGGSGWTGQPSIVKWPEETRAAMNLRPEFAADETFVEVIVGSLDGRVYFLDLATGESSRTETFENTDGLAVNLNTLNPIKGSVSIDPRGFPLLYVGQGIPEGAPIGFRVYSLLDGETLLEVGGMDREAYRGWGAFDSSALVNRETDTLFVGGENGMIYKIGLGTSWDPDVPSLSISPTLTKLRYRLAGNSKQGIENSLAVYKNLAFFADNGGGVVGLDLDTFQPVWSFFGEGTDDTNATIVLEVEDDVPSLYVSTELDRQRQLTGKAWLMKLDGLSGKVLWRTGFAAVSDGVDFHGGIYGTPALGRGRIFATVTNVPKGGKGVLVALSRATGEEVWRWEMPHYGWSSPLYFEDTHQRGYVIQCDSVGTIHLLDARTGEIIDKMMLGRNIESSPALYDDMLVVALRGKTIHGIRIR